MFYRQPPSGLFVPVFPLKHMILLPEVLIGSPESTLILMDVHGMPSDIKHTAGNVGAMVGNTFEVRQEV